MKTNLIQIENVCSEDFKNEIVKGVMAQIKLLNLKSNVEEKSPSHELVTRAETARMLKISLVKLWEITKHNSLVSIKIGGKVLYKRSDIDAFIEINSTSN